MKDGHWWSDTWNPVTGCSPISEGCQHCYAKRMSKRLAGRYGYPKDDPFRVTFHADKLAQPLHWKKPRTVFVCSMGDLFHGGSEIGRIAAVFGIMALCQEHTFIVVTKRHKRMHRFFDFFHGGDYRSNLNWWINEACARLPEAETFGVRNRPMPESLPLPNVIGMVSAENQKMADLRIPSLLSSPFAVRGVSCGPLLGEISLKKYLGTVHEDECGVEQTEQHAPFHDPWVRGLDWVVAEGESGTGARPANPEWFRRLRDECIQTQVDFKLKQRGEYVDELHPEADITACKDDSFVEILYDENGHPIDYKGLYMCKVGRKAAGRELDGRTWDQYPEVVHG